VWHISLANLRQKPGRFIATMLAVIVGTGFLAGALVLNDSLGPALADTSAIALQNVDGVVLPPKATEAENGRGGPRNQEQTLQQVPPDLVQTVQGVSGVNQAAGVIPAAGSFQSAGNLKLLDGSGNVIEANAVGRNWVTESKLNPFTIVQGNPPLNAGQIALDTNTAKDNDLSVGSQVQLATASGPAPVTVAGLTNFGEKASQTPDGDLLVSPPDAFKFLTGGKPGYSAVYINAKPGVDQTALASAVQAAVKGNFDVETGADYLAGQQSDAAGFASFISIGLSVFAYVALAVAIFIIYNTFAIIVAQRTREYALLRAVGASTKQVKRAVRVEAFLVGLVASAIGILLGIVLFESLVHLVPQFKSIAGGDVGLRVSITSIVWVLFAGTVITLLSAIVPGWRASRVPPVAAMRTTDVDRSGTSKIRMTVGSVFLIAGLVLLLLGATVAKPLLVGFGALVAFLSVLVGGPVLAHYFTRLAAPIANRIGRRSGHIAVANVDRNANRTATTANALVIGVFLVVFVTAAGGAVRDYLSQQVSKLSGADFTVTATAPGTTISPQLVSQVQSTAGVARSTVVYNNFAFSPQGQNIGGLDFAQAEDVFGLKQESGAPLTSLADDQLAVGVVGQQGAQNGGRAGGPKVGDTVDVSFSNGSTKTFTVASAFQINLGLGFPPPTLLMSSRAALAAAPDLQPSAVGVVVQPGEEQSTQNALDKVVGGYSTIQVLPGNFLGQAVKSIFNFLINSVSALLGVAVVIALFGIINTLILSILERTREIGVLRAVGMSRRQLGSMVRVEALVVALLGTLVGMAFGLIVAFALIRPILDQGLTASFPFTQMIIILVIGVVLGIVASLIPAWRANRMNILDSIREF
jgi:putative ABC transport system permease protein